MKIFFLNSITYSRIIHLVSIVKPLIIMKIDIANIEKIIKNLMQLAEHFKVE